MGHTLPVATVSRFIPSRDDVQIIVADDDSSPDVVDFAHFRE